MGDAPKMVWVAAEVVEETVRGNTLVRIANWGDNEVLAIVEEQNTRADLRLPPELLNRVRGAMWIAQQQAAAAGHKKVADHQFDSTWSEQFKLLRDILEWSQP